MKRDNQPRTSRTGTTFSRREALLGLALATAAAGVPVVADGAGTQTSDTSSKGNYDMKAKAFVYTELQISVPFGDVPWENLNKQIAAQQGFLNKSWFSGTGNGSVGGLYSFDSIEAAQHYCTAFFPTVARSFGVAQTTRVFDASVVEDASTDMGSPHFGVQPTQGPGAFVYTEVQVNVPFAKAPWKDRNPVLRTQAGLISKLWLSGLNTNTLGGVDAFDTIENAKAFAIDDFPETAAKMNAAFYTRVFDAKVAENASMAMNSPYYA